MRALVTGGSGFLGRHMVAALLEDGHTVLSLIRPESKKEIKAHPRIRTWKGDITIPESIKGIAKNVDVVYHFAAQLGEWDVPEDLFYCVNVEGTKNLLEECLKNSRPHFVFISTPGVQGKGHKRAQESLPYNPPYFYEKTKCEAEKLVIHYNKSHGLPMDIVRPDFVYGPGDYRRIPLYRAIKKRRFLIIGDGKSILHPTYVDDVISSLLIIGRHKKGMNEIFNIAGPEQLTVENYVKTMAEIMGVTFPMVRIPLFIGKMFALFCENLSSITGRPPMISRSKIEFLTKDHGCNITKAEKILNFHPRYDFKRGFTMTFNWIKRNNLI